MKLTDTEWTVMHALWQDAPASARDILDRVETDWAYTTTKTILERLAEKGAVAVTKQGNQSFYQPRVSRQVARRSAVRGLLDRAFDGAFGPLLQHLVADESLSVADRRALKKMLAEQKKTGRGR